LTLTVPVAEEAKPRRIEIGRSDDSHTTIGGHKTISGESTESHQNVGSST
jgi:hypothetical protein